MISSLSSIVPEPQIIATDAVSRLNFEGQREKLPFLDIIDGCREALARMPEGKTGIVIGSGRNTNEWKYRGWKTLDKDPVFEPDLACDANLMSETVPPGSQDFIFAECLTFDPFGEKGVVPARLLAEANKVLKTGGKLIIKTAHEEDTSKSKFMTIPDRRRYMYELQKHGFHGISELGKLEGSMQRVIYWGEKVRDGYKRDYDGKVVNIID